MKYLIYIGFKYIPKNTVQKAALLYLESFSRMMVDSNGLEGFKAMIIENIAQINSAYPRCKPITAKWQHTLDSSEDLYLQLGDADEGIVCGFSLKYCREDVRL